MIDADQAEIDQKYDEYVFNKLKIKINPILIDETVLRKRVLYRSASAEAIMRRSEYNNIRGSLGKFKRSHKMNRFDL